MQRTFEETVRPPRTQPPAPMPSEKPAAKPTRRLSEDEPILQRAASDLAASRRNEPVAENPRSMNDLMNDDRILSDRERTDRALYENGGFDLSPRGRAAGDDGGTRKEFSPVSGPSFLGLEPQPSQSAATYLYDDEPESGHGRLYLGIVLLLAVGGGLFWQWQHEGYPWNPPAKPTVNNSVDPGDTAEEATSSSTAAAAPANPPAAVPAKPDAAPADVPKPESAAAEAQPPKTEEPEKPIETAEKTAETPSPRKTVRQAAPEVAPPDPSEALFADGQRYLYGSGVPENCTLARTKLMAAAGQSNSKAQSTIATMYATGHCLPRNLPSAYHWFAQALHKERDNIRLQRDLEMLWNQMTPEEKEIALKSR